MKMSDRPQGLAVILLDIALSVGFLLGIPPIGYVLLYSAGVADPAWIEQAWDSGDAARFVFVVFCAYLTGAAAATGAGVYVFLLMGLASALRDKVRLRRRKAVPPTPFPK